MHIIGVLATGIHAAAHVHCRTISISGKNEYLYYKQLGLEQLSCCVCAPGWHVYYDSTQPVLLQDAV